MTRTTFPKNSRWVRSQKLAVLLAGILATTAIYATYSESEYYPENCSNCQSVAAYADYQRRLLAELKQYGVEITPIGDTFEIVLHADLFFKPINSTRVIYTQIPVLYKVAEFLRTCGRNVYIDVSGHTDNVGTDQAKFRRSLLQAETIAAYFWAAGLPLKNISVVGCGDTQPVSSNKTLAGSAANRRIVITTDP